MATPKTPKPKRKIPHIDQIQTRPLHITSKKGNSGTAIHLQANFFQLTSQTDWCLYQYRVDIAPDEDRTHVRKNFLRHFKNDLGAYMFDGTVLYTSKWLPQPLEFNSIREEDKQPIKINIRLVGDLVKGKSQYFQFFNMVIRKCLEFLHLQLVGRNYYDASSHIGVPEYHLELWPGYITSIRQHEKSVMMCTEISHKVMRDQTLLCILQDFFKKYKDGWKQKYLETVIGNVVLTPYNNRTYRIDDVDFEMNPDRFFKMRDGCEISYTDYYKQKYQIIINDKTQPLLVSKSKLRDIRAGQKEVIYLIPELCRTTGLTDEMRNNFHLMKALSEHTRVCPTDRIKRLLKFNNRLRSNIDIVKEFALWNFSLSKDLIELPGRLLKPENILFGKQRIVPKDADWNFQAQENMPLKGIPLKDWVAIVPKYLMDESKSFIDLLIKSAAKMSLEVARPKLIEIANDGANTYAIALTKIMEKLNPQIVFCVVKNNQSLRYSVIKKKLCIERPVPSQVVLSKNFKQKTPTMMNNICCKIVTQINCKIGGIPWSVELSVHIPGLMVVGFDVCHDKSSHGSDFGAMVASLDQNFGQFYSAVSHHSSGEELSNDLSMHLNRALIEFRKANRGKLPSRILIYRDGVGEGQLSTVREYEVAQIKKMLTHAYEGYGEFKLSFIIVTKRINTRIFSNQKNPSPGTVVDDVITDPLKYDFFIVSQNVRQGTVTPTSYNVIEDSSDLNPDKMQQITFKLCHMYYNFAGTVRVPAPCQYAHKLAFFVSQTLGQAPDRKLEKLLYFL